MATVGALVSVIHGLAPVALKEDYDNVGLLSGDVSWPVTGVLVALDCTEAVVAEAAERGCNVVVCHHPLVFAGLKKVDYTHWVGRTLVAAITHKIALIACHTNLDTIHPGVNTVLATTLGLVEASIRPLRERTGELRVLTVFVPTAHRAVLLKQLHLAGAGQLGTYADCSFVSNGIGSYTPTETSIPFEGSRGLASNVPEERVEVTYPAFQEKQILVAMRKAHPYEEIAYYTQKLENSWQQAGAGAIGRLPKAIPLAEFLANTCKNLQTGWIQHSAPTEKMVELVALCGGAGSFLLKDALAASADVFVTGDLKHHEWLEADSRLTLIDVGHYVSEYGVCAWLVAQITQKMPNFAVSLAERVQSPVRLYSTPTKSGEFTG
jgi:dinuclear metal center YbgI/SA1388 family protein